VRRAALAAALVLSALPASPCSAADAVPFWDLRFGSPEKLSAGLGVLIGDARGEGFDMGSRSLLVELRPGLDGGSLAMGLAPFHAGSGGFTFAGVALRARLLRTWGSPVGLPPDQTYAGAELSVAWIIQASLGVVRRVSGSSGPTTALTWSVGLGL
jgi:hypothetical protein